jgi:hypothetical protein
VFGLISKIKDIKLPKKRVSLEAWRMKREDIKNIMSAAIEVKKSIPQGIDFIPSSATSKTRFVSVVKATLYFCT